MRLADVRGIVKNALHDFSEHRIVQLSAALAYNAIFAIAPFLLVVIGVAGIVLGQDTVRHQVETQLQSMLGAQATGVINSMMSARHQGASILATVLGTIALVLGAAGVFGQLQGVLNTIWGVKAKPGRGIKGIIRDRFLSLAAVFGICFLLLISMILSTVITASSGAIEHKLSLPAWIGHVVDLVFSIGVLSVLFAAMFKLLPDVEISWRKVWGGAITTAVLFSIGKWALAMYLGRTSTTSAYGAAGSFVIILMWVYYASIIVFLGAEITQAATRYSGVKVQPTENAVLAEPTNTPGKTVATKQSEPAPDSRPRRSLLVPVVFSVVAAVHWIIDRVQRRRTTA
jgi:membrane protein